MSPLTKEEFNELSPLQKLLKSRKFLLVVLDLVVSMVTFFVAKYAAPQAVEDVKFLIIAIQPVIITLIGAIAYEDGQEKRNGNLTSAVG